MKVLFLDNFPTIFAIIITWALLCSWRQFHMRSLISLNCIAEVRSSWNVIFSWSIPVVSVGCTAGFIPDLPRLPHTERHFPSSQQNPHQPPSLPTFSPNDRKSHLSPGLWRHLPPKTHITVPSALTLKVMMRWVKWNSASRLSWIVTFSRPEKERDKDKS